MSETEPHADNVVRLARAWIGTPYHYQGCTPGVGTDCLGLIRGIWRELYGRDAERPPPYTRDWAEGSGRETLLEAARRHLIEIPPFAATPGDVLVFRWRRNALAKHCAILSALPLPACGERAGVRGSIRLVRGSDKLVRGSDKLVRGRHTGTPVGSATMIHALEGAPVSEVPVSPWWRRHIAGAFASGDFRLPGFVHDRPVPGTAEMAALRDRISYTADTLPGGGEVRLRTSDSVALRAIHQFLAFQRQDHRAGGAEPDAHH